MSRRSRIAALAAVFLLVGFVLYLARNWIAETEAFDSLSIGGNLEGRQSVLSFKTVQSRIVELPFDEGQWVKAGALLARVDPSDYAQRAKIAEADLKTHERQHAVKKQDLEAANKTIASDEANLQLQQLQFNRAQTLLKRRSGTIEARDRARASLEEAIATLERDRALLSAAERNITVAQANVQNARASHELSEIYLRYTALFAPFDGAILVRQAELGEVVAPGTPIVTLAELDHLWLRGYVKRSLMERVRCEELIMLTTDARPGRAYRGRISFIASNIEFTPKSVDTRIKPQDFVYRIRIDFDNPTHELLIGMPVNAQIRLLPPGAADQSCPPSR